MQIDMDFTATAFPSFKDDLTGPQLKRLYSELVRGAVITCNDCGRLGIAGSALPRRIKDLRDLYHIKIQISKVVITRAFDGKQVYVSAYHIVK